MKLVIVESPTKAKTLAKLLGKDYKVTSSKGHIRDLPKKELGVDTKKDFAPKYVINPSARKTVTQLKKDALDVDTIVLATDLDREGEAIAWHLHAALTSGKNSAKDKKFERVVFHEITKNAVEEAFSHVTKINDDLVDAQQARRILDRLVGYKLSPLLWKKVRYGLSAGRVQSVAVRIIVERERERNAFKPDEYWSIVGDFLTEDKDKFTAELSKINGKKVKIGNESSAKAIEKDLKDDSFIIDSIKKTERKRSPGSPFKTSTLQQTASNTFGFTARKTMRAAQGLFEKGLITYHRTDSLSLSPQFVKSARSFIKKELGSEFLPEKAPAYKTKSKNAQEAHEAIRPTDAKSMNPGGRLKGEEAQVYSLIWKRSLESQMLPAIYDQTTVIVGSGKGYEFRATGSVIKFEGYLAIGKMMELEDLVDIKRLPDVKEKAVVEMEKHVMSQHFTQPPGRYSDATLIKALEEIGVGRPSTYAPTISTIQARKYIRKEGRYFIPEDVAFVVTDLLIEHFPKVIDYDFTAKMENSLDDVATGDLEWVPVIRDFYEPFEKILEEKEESLHKADITKLGESEEKCPDCGKILFIKLGKYGKFLSCSAFPECEFAKPMDGEGVDGNGDAISFGDCEECEDGKMTLKQGRFGKFLACSNYPKCKTTKPYLDKIGMECPKCKEDKREGGDVITKKAKGRTFYGCSNYPKCDYASWKNPLPEQDD